MHAIKDIKKSTRYEVASCFRVHPATISRWKKDGCPVNADETFDLRDVIEFRLKQIASEAQAIPETSESQEALIKLREEDRKTKFLKRQILERKYMPIDKVSKEWAARIISVTATAETLKDRLPPMLEGKSRHEISQIIGREVRAMREAYSQTGKYTQSEKVLSILEPCLERLNNI